MSAWLVMMGVLASASSGAGPTTASAPSGRGAWTYACDGVIRGDTSKKSIALIFTAGDFGEGSGHVLDVLARRKIKASLFVTGAYVGKPEYAPHLRRMVAEGHYLGPHSDAHPLYCSWEDREKTLVTREFFERDLRKNIDALRGFGALKATPIYFIPPYEHYNREQVAWAREMGIVLFNFTPGIGSNRDYVPEGQPRFFPSKVIYEDILAFERRDPHGLSGALLLLHLGADRKDKMYLLLEPLVEELTRRGYRFVRVDEMLAR